MVLSSESQSFMERELLEKIRQLMKFIREAVEELKKVSWLTRPQMIASTWFVVLLVIVFSVFVGVLDFVIMNSFHFFIS